MSGAASGVEREASKPVGETAPVKTRRIAKCAPIDIEFQDLTYAVRDARIKGGWRKLLRGINGIFKSGELTAILGPSGAGKSTLLNILAGYVSAGVRGTIKMNDRPRDMKIFNKLSSYIMQDDIVQPRLSVKEAMMIAAHLKLGLKCTEREKLVNVEEICKLLGLQSCMETRSEYLSGGQRKRLAVALELLNNPPVIFLDEPTTGLDNYAIKQCMDLLYDISKEGRTVVCTIHQPPTSLFQKFDQVYVLANGYCVYNGSPSKLVTFLSNVQFTCPLSYTPAEFIIEVVTQYPETIGILSTHSHNGRVNLAAEKVNIPDRSSIQYQYEIYQETTAMGVSDMNVEFPLPLWGQFVILLKRMFLQISRNKTALFIQFILHFISALLFGGIFFGIGNNASQIGALFKFCISVTVFLMYTCLMTPVLIFPSEVKLLKREYFNRWYSLKAYYMAVTVSGIPLLILFSMLFLVVVYFFSYQPMEIERFILFCIAGISIALCSQGLGYAIGAVCNILTGSIIGSSTITPLLAFAVYGMGYKDDIENHMRIMMKLSFARFGLVGFCTSIFDERPQFECNDEIYCHYINPKDLMSDMGMEGSHYGMQILGVVIFMLVFRAAAYLALKYRLSSEFSTKVVHYAKKLSLRKKNISIRWSLLFPMSFFPMFITIFYK
ncbi:hypothetical protein WA026_023607 [Henosepilachna vigintioctopunctata]|uniref:ABC transporter domain-containing protein n=1 Tax=Henosepilachna vigintioctopunctata TaxID=420089 RepID=A0AAW1UCQ1_9CUCU